MLPPILANTTLNFMLLLFTAISIYASPKTKLYDAVHIQTAHDTKFRKVCVNLVEWRNTSIATVMFIMKTMLKGIVVNNIYFANDLSATFRFFLSFYLCLFFILCGNFQKLWIIKSDFADEYNDFDICSNVKGRIKT